MTRSLTRLGAPLLAAGGIAALVLFAYRALPGRPFAADDYQWLLAVRGRSLGDLVAAAFDVGGQSHFYRPIVWLMIWAQERAFGLDPAGFHLVSLALHLLSAALLGALVYRLSADDGRRTTDGGKPTSLAVDSGRWSVVRRRWSGAFPHPWPAALLAAGFVALHPAPFEAVVWISAQSEQLAATLLLMALHLWLTALVDWRASSAGRWSAVGGRWSVLATLALGLALLTKESAVVGLPLLALLTLATRQPLVERTTARTSPSAAPPSFVARRFLPLAAPLLLTLAYLALQLSVERRDDVVAGGAYGLGPQLLLNPLRSLGLIVAPLPGTESASAAWLPWVGVAVALGMVVWPLARVGRSPSRLHASRSARRELLRRYGALAGLIVTLLPTAPFISPPDSRYLYLPAMAFAVWLACTLDDGRRTTDDGSSLPTDAPSHRRVQHSTLVYRLSSIVLLLALAWYAVGEIRAREGRFAAASEPGASLERLMREECAAGALNRAIIVDPPLVPAHAEAIVQLTCGDRPRPVVVTRDEVEGALRGHSLVVAFEDGRATVVRRTD